MKKIVFLSAFALVALASCKKDYTCKCTEQVSDNAVTTSHQINNVALDDAKKTCDAKEIEGLTTCSLL